jgi:hypothetical protein
MQQICPNFLEAEYQGETGVDVQNTSEVEGSQSEICNVCFVLQDGQGREKQLFKKVAVVENFFDIIYSVHVEMEGRAGKHAGQKRTYRTVSRVNLSF